MDENMLIDQKHLDDRFRDYLANFYEHELNFESSNRKEIIFTRFNSLQQIESCSKKLPIISDKNFFCESIDPDTMSLQDKANTFRNNVVFRNDVVLLREQQSEYSALQIWFQTRDFGNLQRWFLDSINMIKSNRVTYVPYIDKLTGTKEWPDPPDYIDEHGIDRSLPHIDENRESDLLKISEIIRHSKSWEYVNEQQYFTATTESDIQISDSYYKPLFNFEIPGLENITPSQLSILMDEHPDELLKFRNYMLRKLSDLEPKSLGSEYFFRDIRRAELDIQEGLRELKENYRKLAKTTAIKAIGADAITWAVFVYLFLSEPNELLKIVLPGGAIAALSRNLTRYLKEKWKLKSDPLNFLIVVSKKSKKL